MGRATTKETFIERNIGEPIPIDNEEVHLSPREFALREMSEDALPESPFEILNLQPIPKTATKEEWYQYLENHYCGDPREYFKKTFARNVLKITGEIAETFFERDRSDTIKTGTLIWRLTRLVPQGLQLLTSEHAWIEDATFRPYPKQSGPALEKTAFVCELRADLLFNIRKQNETDAVFLKGLYSAISNLEVALKIYQPTEEQFNRLSQLLFNKGKRDDRLSVTLIKSSIVNRADKAWGDTEKIVALASQPLNTARPLMAPEETNTVQKCAEALCKRMIGEIIYQYKRFPGEQVQRYEEARQIEQICKQKSALIERYKILIQDTMVNKTKLTATIPGDKNSPSDLIKCLSDFADDNAHVPDSEIVFKDNSDENAPFTINLHPLKRSRLPDLHMDYWDLRYKFYEKTYLDLPPEYKQAVEHAWDSSVGEQVRCNQKIILALIRNNNLEQLKQIFQQLEAILGPLLPLACENRPGFDQAAKIKQ